MNVPEYDYSADDRNSIGTIRVLGCDLILDYEVDVYYFKQSGKYYHEAHFYCYIPGYISQGNMVRPDETVLANIMRDLRKKSRAPGLTGCSEFDIVVIPRGGGVPFQLNAR